MNKSILIIVTIGFVLVLALMFISSQPTRPATPPVAITNFEECAEAGNPVAESYPRQCSANGKTFVENVGNGIEQVDKIRVNNPKPNTVITSPLVITGEARGKWFFEATFPIHLYDSTNNEIGSGFAEAQSEWMTEEFVPFTATITFVNPKTKQGRLVLEKSNPSGLPENSDQLTIPVKFE